MPGNGKNAEEWSSKDKFGVVLETAGLNEAELAEYCRRKGLFVEQVADMARGLPAGERSAAERNRELREQSKSDRKGSSSWRRNCSARRRHWRRRRR